VQSFSENTDDVTGRYTNLEIDLQTEKDRLARYEAMYKEAKNIEDKINLNDRIFNQERRVSYLEDAIANIDQRIEYATIQVSLTEKQSVYAAAVFVTFADLINNVVNNVNRVLRFIFGIIPWLLLLLAGGFIWKRFRK